MKKYCLIIGMVVCLMAHTTTGTRSGRDFEVKRHNINNIELCISNYGQFGHDDITDDCGLWWPKGSGNTYLFGAGIWFGTVDSITGDTLVTIGYGPSGGEHEVVPGLFGQDFNDPSVIIYMYPDPWPAPQDTFPMAPQDHLSHQDSWCCYNDGDSLYHMPGDTRPIEIEIYQTVYAWDVSPTVEDMIFFTHEVKNVSGHTLQNCYIGLCTDCDIGNEGSIYANDRIAGILGRWYVIAAESVWVSDLGYQWQEVEEPGWTDFPGTIGFDLFQTPFDLVPGQDKDGDGILDQYERDSSYYVNNLPDSLWDADMDGVPDWRDPSQNPQIGMTALKGFVRGLDPDTDPERYLMLAGYNHQTGIYDPYDTLPSDENDQRFLMASGPFELAPDSTATIVFVVVLANWYNIYGSPDSALVIPDGLAQYIYDMNWNITGVEEGSSLPTFHVPLAITPNPFSRHAKISFSIPQTGYISLSLYDVTGRLVKEIMQTRMNAGSYTIDLNTRGLAQGTYFLMLETVDSKASRSLVILR